MIVFLCLQECIILLKCSLPMLLLVLFDHRGDVGSRYKCLFHMSFGQQSLRHLNLTMLIVKDTLRLIMHQGFKISSLRFKVYAYFVDDIYIISFLLFSMTSSVFITSPGLQICLDILSVSVLRIITVKCSPYSALFN